MPELAADNAMLLDRAVLDSKPNSSLTGAMHQLQIEPQPDPVFGLLGEPKSDPGLCRQRQHLVRMRTPERPVLCTAQFLETQEELRGYLGLFRLHSRLRLRSSADCVRGAGSQGPTILPRRLPMAPQRRQQCWETLREKLPSAALLALLGSAAASPRPPTQPMDLACAAKADRVFPSRPSSKPLFVHASVLQAWVRLPASSSTKSAAGVVKLLEHQLGKRATHWPCAAVQFVSQQA